MRKSRHPASPPLQTAGLLASQRGFTLLTAPVLTVVTVGLAMLTPMMIRERIDTNSVEVEHHHLQEIGNGIVTFVRHHQAFPPNLAASGPPTLCRFHFNWHEITMVSLRYLAFHPGLAGFQNKFYGAAGQQFGECSFSRDLRSESGGGSNHFHILRF
ncbi:MAG: hypothetical protein R3B83_04055 [Nitrospirales bacterium]|nr:hypothetical protein [Nitrospirales bacterium]